MSRPAQWALSPLDLQAHLLLAEGCHPKGVLKARCGHLLPLMVMRFAEFTARKCTHCHLISLSDAILALRRENPAPISPKDPVGRRLSPAPRHAPGGRPAQLIGFPQLRTAAFLAVLRTEVIRRSGKGHSMTICLPVTEVISIDAMASVDTVAWRCRLCDHHGTTTTRPTAHSDGIEHLTTEHHATIGTAPD